uniref:glycosyltransferase family 39 protein n=1 Tax=Acidocella sp. TaxID=50710 RepID=UPI002613439E
MFTAGAARGLYAGQAGLGRILLDLRRLDVHPPLYFWALEIWRRLLGPGWFTARLLSAGVTLAGLYGLACIARRLRVAAGPVLAMALLSYGFCYTAILARPYALAGALNIAGVGLALAAAEEGRRGPAWAAGLCLGAACFSEYLAVFTGVAALLWLGWRRPGQAARALAAMLPWLAACGWVFLGQRDSRQGQFAPFSWHAALAALARDGGAALFGGLPLYAGAWRGAVAALLGLLALLGLALALRRRQSRGFLALAAATPAGLLALGLVFRATPIEIRYLAFALPWLALALAPALPPWPRALWLGAQALAVAGLVLAP